MPDRFGVLLSCEHGGNRLPEAYARLFRNRQRLLNSHRGYDAGSLQLARHLSRDLGAPLIAATVTRLLVDLNRSLGHRQLFSEVTRSLARAERERILSRYYFPHRQAVETAIAAGAAQGACTLHLSVHSFTPVLNDKIRRTDVGLLYDPARRDETIWCRRVQAILQEIRPDLLVHRNAPYRGNTDGLTTALRRRFTKERYVGIELEVNQRFVADTGSWLRLRRAIAATLREALAH